MKKSCYVGIHVITKLQKTKMAATLANVVINKLDGGGIVVSVLYPHISYLYYLRMVMNMAINIYNHRVKDVRCMRQVMIGRGEFLKKIVIKVVRISKAHKN